MTLPLWTLAKGAAKFTAAILTGDWATDADTEARRKVCRQCPTMVLIRLPFATADSHVCGREEILGVSCMCLIAGKTAVASQACPQGKWQPVGRRQS